MRNAAVGYQCPDDAARDRSVQRPLRNAVGAAVRQSPPWVTGGLLALNIAAYLVTGLTSSAGVDQPEGARLFRDWWLLPAAVHADDGYYRLLTAAFLHANLLHIAVNMLSLVFIGPTVERFLGPTRYAALYLLGALGSSAAVYAFGAPHQPVVGASGALFALLGACLALARRIGLDLQYLVGIVVLNFVLTFSVAGISKLGHIGGFVTGILVAVALAGLPRQRRRLAGRAQALGLAGVLLLIVLAVAVRTVTFSG
jgi:membrane associated rhomboid family serine protease